MHAAGQVVSFEAPDGTDPVSLAARLNRRLAPEVSVRGAATVPDSFDARFSAKRREYEYHLYHGPAPDPFSDRFALHVTDELDLKAMRAAAKAFVGEHDFSSFCRRGEGSLVRRLRSISFSRPSPGRLVIGVVGDSFCHQMVRSLVGLLLDIGRGRRPADDAQRVLAARDRSTAAGIAPAKGLTLVSVGYARTALDWCGSPVLG